MKLYLTSCILLLTGLLAFGQSGPDNVYTIDNEQVSVRLLGTSTVHDWEMAASSVSGSAVFAFAPTDEQALTGLESLTFTLVVTDLRSDNEKLDRNAYEALHADKHQTIRYDLASATLNREPSGYLIKSIGQLTIAGTTRDIEMDVHLTVAKDGTVNCKGSYALKMTDYGVEPPTFLLGVMKTGDDLTLEFSVTYRQRTGA